ncbi:hypothetical protein [Musicola keenii]|uniref:hypothetical protein n=1 Tax=Musicola keenii TaxID=2884250 RepID=UPI001F265DBA|nr:hypothetical protein [Musicola keenii]
MPARTLFEITRGATLFLNPKSDCGKEFLPYEVEQLLAGGLSQAPEQRVVEKDAHVLLGQPAHYLQNLAHPAQSRAGPQRILIRRPIPAPIRKPIR